MKLSASGLHVALGGTPILRGVGLDVSPRTVTALIGPNGAGKSTLLRSLAGIVPYRGTVLLDGADARSLDARTMSQRVAYLPQDLQARSRLGIGHLASRAITDVSLGQRQLAFVAQGPRAGPKPPIAR